MARRWRNYTDLPDAELRALYLAVCPPGLPAHDIEIKNHTGHGRGRAYGEGSAYHTTARPFVVVSLPRTERDARHRWRPLRGGYLPMTIGSRREAAVMLLAHELRHLWQARAPREARRRGLVYGSRGRMSERDADAYALQMLRRYRRGELGTPTAGNAVDQE